MSKKAVKVSKRHAKKIFVFIEANWNMTREEITGPCRADPHCFIRVACYYHLYRSKSYSMAAIGEVFQRDKSTVHNGLSMFDGVIRSKLGRSVIDTFIQGGFILKN